MAKRPSICSTASRSSWACSAPRNVRAESVAERKDAVRRRVAAEASRIAAFTRNSSVVSSRLGRQPHPSVSQGSMRINLTSNGGEGGETSE